MPSAPVEDCRPASAASVKARLPGLNERHGQLLRQFDGWDILQISQGWANLAQPLGN